MSMFRIGDSSLPFLSPIHPKGLDIELARRHTIALLEAAGEVRRGGEPTRECDFSEGLPTPRGPRLSRQQSDRVLQPNPLHKFVERLANQRSEDSMKVKR